jgi:predicted dehydrogenase
VVRVSLIGCGRWGSNILRDLLALGCQVDVADPDFGARERSRSAGAGSAVPSLDRLPASDGIVIATPTSIHAATIREALACGKPIFVEKPLTSDVETAREFAEQAAGRVFVMDKWRYHPGIEELARIARTRELGAPLGMRLRQVGWGTRHGDVDANVDVTWVLLPHCLSIALEVLGFIPDPKHAFAATIGGRTVALEGALGAEPWLVAEVSERSPVKVREFQLHCEHGVAWLDDGWADHISIATGDGPVIEKRAVARTLPLYSELEAFVRHLKGGPAPRSSVQEGAQIVEAIAELRALAGLE